jgi:tripartite ATP-independent transporter DctM subunit
MGPVRGGLAVATEVACTIFAAMSGVSGAGCVTMGVVALPEMLKRKYDKKLAVGSILSGGALGVLIPPSIIMIIYGGITGVSVMKLFAGGILTGLCLASLFIMYIVLVCLRQPQLGPALPSKLRATWGEKLISLKGLILPGILIVSVLGSMFLGMATPTEAAGIGAVGALICGLVNRKLNWNVMYYASYETFKVFIMILWCVIGVTIFRQFYVGSGTAEIVNSLLMAVPAGKYGVLITIVAILFILGAFVDPVGITMICAPVFAPVIQALGFDPVWFGVLFVVVLETSYLTPPVGFNLFYMKGVVPPGITMLDIYYSAIPFVGLQVLGIIITIIFPQLATWLPSILIK